MTSFTSVENWEKYITTGDNKYLNDIDPFAVPLGKMFVIAGEGWNRMVCFDNDLDNKIDKMHRLLDEKIDILTDTMLDGMDRIYDRVIENK